jgi:hypothetical protein
MRAGCAAGRRHKRRPQAAGRQAAPRILREGEGRAAGRQNAPQAGRPRRRTRRRPRRMRAGCAAGTGREGRAAGRQERGAQAKKNRRSRNGDRLFLCLPAACAPRGLR